MRRLLLILVLFVAPFALRAEEADKLYYALRNKVLSVKDYTAEVKMKIDVVYMKIPELEGKLYFKAPDKMRMERKDGISIMPKKNINLTLNSLIPAGNVTVIDAGTATIKGRKLRILKVIPEDDKVGIVLTKIWVDEAQVLAYRTETTTKDEGTVVLELEYGKHIKYALPDKISIILDVKEYALPKGVTMDYSELSTEKDMKPKPKDNKASKGTIDIQYLNYVVNKGISDAVFKDKDGKR